METILEMISTYGLETVILALVINILTGVIKLPVKHLAKKKGWDKLLKLIVFLPLLLGFGVSALYTYLRQGTVDFGGVFYTLWISSTSLSLAIYAVLEKLVPSKRKILEDYEVKQNLAAIEKLSETTGVNPTEPKQEKMILKGKNHASER